MTPPGAPGGGPKGQWNFPGILLGCLAGFIVCAIQLVYAFSALSAASATCTDSRAMIAAGLGFLAFLGVATWLSLYRLRGPGFGVYVLRGFLVTVFVYMAIPWPCSASWAGVYTVGDRCSTARGAPPMSAPSFAPRSPGRTHR